ncbi:15690_t:CDS:2 [Rhizophagus irregularis]|uniref:Uncharacterized protein n=1 Tax=Rhizophagus irregularis (strain DAOM 181602 / DAOM 197198 / MUCL 43194) TaxID=747089 RepID=U9TA51_RHIID|nr:15690_t:CDS:2 [Rhizophagus irregularis]
MESELEVLRQRITELEAENAELRVIKQRNAELEAKLELWKQRVNLHEEKIAELKAKRAELRQFYYQRGDDYKTVDRT